MMKQSQHGKGAGRRLAGGGLAAALALCLTAATGAAGANSLRDHKEINNGLTVIAVGDLIRTNCSTISARMVSAYFFARSLEAKAKAAGFSDDEIEAFVEDKAEKARVMSAARRYLVARGVDLDVPDSYCQAGYYEIERNSQIGVLLKAK
ncbi:MAG: DUF5333 domain-containing protein [Pseudomonadota bacterium]|jgi:hypothetical protein|nr:DUF5333 domain-containing protein [Pseudomonadota bacterium]|tara:strand:+ start:1491 stop:1940 length:450 start_codon:yes stop_codon:yes gene_type:complete